MYTDGYYFDTVQECHFTEDLSLLEYIWSYSFDKAEFIRFNSTMGQYEGYTELGVYNAEQWNKGPQLTQAKAQLDRYCRVGAPIKVDAILKKNGECIKHLIFILTVINNIKFDDLFYRIL